jgi:hypothetical protein
VQVQGMATSSGYVQALGSGNSGSGKGLEIEDHHPRFGGGPFSFGRALALTSGGTEPELAIEPKDWCPSLL